MVRVPRAILYVTLLFAAPCVADSIAADGMVYEDVYIQEGAAMYYVQIPSEGRVINVPKSEVDQESLVVSSDEEHRQGLLEEWKANNNARRGLSTAEALSVTLPEAGPDGGGALVGQGSQTGPAREVIIIPGPDKATRERAARRYMANNYAYSRDSGVAEVPVKGRFEAASGPSGIDGGVVAGVAPAGVVKGAPKSRKGKAAARIFTLQRGFGDTLPKVIVRNEGGLVGAFPIGGGLGGGGFGRGGGISGGGLGGGFVGGGAGGGVGGGAFGGGMTFGNISELFDTFDDTQVGEAPANIEPVFVR